MTVVIVDPAGALIQHLKSLPAVTTLCPAANVTGNLQSVAGGSAAVAVVTVSGDRDPSVPLWRVRLDLHVYGSTGFEAMRLWRTVISSLEPVTRNAQAFTAAHCRVTDARTVAGPTNLPDGDWARVWGTVQLTVAEIPVSG